MGVRVRRIGRVVVSAAVAAVVAGLVAGLAGRVLMRGIAMAIGRVEEVTLDGTFSIVVLFTALAVPAAATAAAPPLIRTAGRWVTAAVTGWLAAGIGVSDAVRVGISIADRLALLATLTMAFGALVVGFGHLAQFVTRRLAGSPPPAPAVPAAGATAPN
jgi:hypothetical protein